VRPLLDFLAFQALWFACVLGAACGAEWLGPAGVLAWCAFHLARSPRRMREARALLAVTLLGTLADTLISQAGWLHYAGTPLAGCLAPAWIAALWAAFATTFDTTFAWVARDLRLAALLGALAAPLSYWAGERLGALEVGTPRSFSLVCVGAVWAAALPLAIRAYRR
jgi:Protein of unknown function (DUF2878)